VLGHPASSRQTHAQLIDLSEYGCKVLTGEPLCAGEHLTIKLSNLQPFPAKVAWLDSDYAGLEFGRQIHCTIVEHYARVFAAY
jgi:hypothetical protein